MIYALFTLLVALVISAVAAYYSIVGLTAIFSAAVMPIIIMGAALEVGKITAAVWLKLNWSRASMTYKMYLVPAVVVLMLLTSMGIFGFLSKAHIDHGVPTGDVASQISIIDEKIKIERDNIENARALIAQLDGVVNALTTGQDRTGKRKDGSEFVISSAERALSTRRQQAKDRAALTKQIEDSQKTVIELQKEKAPIASGLRKAEAEVGPIKYIAALIYGDNPDQNILEKSVRWVIIVIVSVFDPLALVLILSAQQSLRWHKEDKEKKKQELKEQAHEALIHAIEPKLGEIEPGDENGPNRFVSNVDSVASVNGVIDDNSGSVSGNDSIGSEETVHQEVKENSYPTLDTPVEDNLTVEEQTTVEKLPPHHPDTHPYLRNSNFWKKPEGFESVGPLVHYPEPEELDATVSKSIEPKEQIITDDPSGPIIKRQGDYIVVDGKKLHMHVFSALINGRPVPNIQTGLQADNIDAPPKSSFGTHFPSQAKKGDMFLRVDSTPNKLFKFNGSSWIEVDKELTDSYTYDKQYIQFLINKLTTGEYELDQLSTTEQELVAEELNNQKSDEQET